MKISEETVAEEFQILTKEICTQIQEAHWVPNKVNPNKPTPRHIIIKMAKVKERILKTGREKQRVNYKGTSIRLSADFSTETLQVKRSGKTYSKF